MKFNRRGGAFGAFVVSRRLLSDQPNAKLLDVIASSTFPVSPWAPTSAPAAKRKALFAPCNAGKRTCPSCLGAWDSPPESLTFSKSRSLTSAKICKNQWVSWGFTWFTMLKAVEFMVR